MYYIQNRSSGNFASFEAYLRTLLIIKKISKQIFIEYLLRARLLVLPSYTGI